MTDLLEPGAWIASMKQIRCGVWLVVVKDGGGWRFGGWRRFGANGNHIEAWEGVREEERALRFEDEEAALGFFEDVYQHRLGTSL